MKRKETKILLVDDEALDNKCRKILFTLEAMQIKYDIATNYDEAQDKLMYHSDEYKGIILDMYFPRQEGDKKSINGGEELVKWLEEWNINLPIMINSTSLAEISSRLIVGRMCSWEIRNLKRFLEFLRK